MTTKEKNKLVALFMGATAEQWYSEVQGMSGVHFVYPKEGAFPDNKRHHPDSGLKYDTSWDWLMPACKKWDNLDENWDEYQREEYARLCDELDKQVSRYELEKVYDQFIVCVEWYNDQK